MEVITPSNRRSAPGVLIIHSWWGLTDSFREFGSKLSQTGFTVGLIDLFNGQTAKTTAKAKRLRSAPRRNPMYKDLYAGIKELRNRSKPDSLIGVVGFSMGGHWAVWLSQQPDLPINATVLYYAARAGNFRTSHSSYLVHYAESDDYVSESSKRRMNQNILKAGLSFESYDYTKTLHWFAESERKEFDSESSRIALARTTKHLKLHL